MGWSFSNQEKYLRHTRKNIAGLEQIVRFLVAFPNNQHRGPNNQLTNPQKFSEWMLKIRCQNSEIPKISPELVLFSLKMVTLVACTHQIPNLSLKYDLY